MKHARYLSLIVPTLLLCAPLASAHPVKADEKPQSQIMQELRNIKPLSQEQISEIEDAMPNINGLMVGMRDLMESGEFQQHMETTAGLVKDKINMDELVDGNDGMPDVNGLFDAMLSLLGDQEFIDSLVDGVEPVIEVIEENLPEDFEDDNSHED